MLTKNGIMFVALQRDKSSNIRNIDKDTFQVSMTLNVANRMLAGKLGEGMFQ